MPVNTTHPEYEENLPAWLRARDVIAGEDAIKCGGEKYLPRLEAQTDEEYAAYRDRASFFNTTARTADGYLGLLFRRPPFIKVAGKAGRGEGKGQEKSPGSLVLGRKQGAECRGQRTKTDTSPRSSIWRRRGRTFSRFLDDWTIWM
jgi:hypothetical protein